MFAVQAGAFMSTANAERYAGVLKALGYTPRIRTYVDVHNVRWYRVRFGGSAELVNALAAVEVLRTKVPNDVIPVTERAGR